MTTTCLSLPPGPLCITGDAVGGSAIFCSDEPGNDATAQRRMDALPEPVQQAVTQLNEYFAGSRRAFGFPMTPADTAFQRAVWRVLLTVPFGTTQSHLTLTRALGDVKAIRAVAAANGRNPLAIVLGCRSGALPPRHRLRRLADGLRGWSGAQAVAARTRRRPPETRADVVISALRITRLPTNGCLIALTPF